MNNKTIYRIIYVTIILCILCIILVSVLSTGNKEWDWGLGIFSVVGIIASGVYLILKNKKTAKVTPDLNPNSSLGAADDVIYNKIKEDRDRAIKDKFINEFQKYFKGPTDENDKESNYELGQVDNSSKFEYITNNYLNNKLSIKDYFERILPLFNYTKNNEDELKKNIIKYVVLSRFPRYNKKGVVKPLNYKKLVDLYIKDNTDINNETIYDKIKEYVDDLLEGEKDHQQPEFTIVQLMNENTVQKELKDAYSELENDEKEILIDYIKELLKDVNDDVKKEIINKITAKVAPDLNPNSSTGAADDKNLDQEIYKQIEKDRKIAKDENFHDIFYNKYPVNVETFTQFRQITKAYVNNGIKSIGEYFAQILPLFIYTEKNKDILIKDIIKYVVLYDFPMICEKVGDIMPPNCKILVDLYIKDKPENIKILTKLSDEPTSIFIKDVQENNNELNTIITNYIQHLKTQDKNINVMLHFNNNIKSKIVVPGLFDIIWKKAWNINDGNYPDNTFNPNER